MSTPNIDTNSDLEFKWYSIVTGSEGIQQGDFLENFPIIVPNPTSSLEAVDDEQSFSIDAYYDTANVVIMSQSCDIESYERANDEGPLLICPRYSLSVAQVRNKSLFSKGKWAELKNERFRGAHLLNKCELEGYSFDYQIVDFTHVYSTTVLRLKNWTLFGQVIREGSAGPGPLPQTLPV